MAPATDPVGTAFSGCDHLDHLFFHFLAEVALVALVSSKHGRRRKVKRAAKLLRMSGQRDSVPKIRNALAYNNQEAR